MGGDLGRKDLSDTGGHILIVVCGLSMPKDEPLETQRRRKIMVHSGINMSTS